MNAAPHPRTLVSSPTLIAYVDDEEIFRSDGTWLYPLLELEEALETLTSQRTRSRLTTYDRVVGRAGALLSARLGVVAIETDLLSRLAIPILEEHEIEVTATRTEERVFCATEDLLHDVTDPEIAHGMILRRIEEQRRVRQPIVAIRDLHVRLAGRTVLKDLSLDVCAGETILIRGRNGAGKTTLLRSILGLLSPTAGEIIVEGRTLGSSVSGRRRIAYVRQVERSTTLPISAREVVEIGARAIGTERIRDRAVEALHRTHADHLERRLFRELSGGERQRVSIARALAQQPSILLLDEPTVGLDASARDSLIELLDGLAQRQNVTVIIVSHDLTAEELPRARVLLLEEGILMEASVS